MDGSVRENRSIASLIATAESLEKSAAELRRVAARLAEAQHTPQTAPADGHEAVESAPADGHRAADGTSTNGHRRAQSNGHHLGAVALDGVERDGTGAHGGR